MPTAPSLAELLDGHVALDVECFDRLYRVPRGADQPRRMRDPPGGRRSGHQKLRAVWPWGAGTGREQP